MSGYDHDAEDVADDELARANVPDKLKEIVACKRCGLLKTVDQFHENGCENCRFLRVEDRVGACTTAFYDGQVAVTDPQSWAAKWIRVDDFYPGVYAISVTGELSDDIREDLANRGLQWRCKPSK